MRKPSRFGWTSLALWALLGFALEAAHGFKLAPYLDDPLTRLLLTLAHAHGVGLALVVIVHDLGAPPLHPWVRSALRVSAVLMPLGFAAGAIGHPESDPSIGIVFVPMGALLLLAALFATARRAWTEAEAEAEAEVEAEVEAEAEAEAEAEVGPEP